MAKDKKKNVLLYAIIAVVAVMAIIVGVVITVNNNGLGGSQGGSLGEYENVDVAIEYGDFDAMQQLATDIQNGWAIDKIVQIDGIVSHPLTIYSIVEPNADDSVRIGTQFVIEGDGEYPEDGVRAIITGKVVEVSPLYYVIQTLPELIEVQK